MPDFDEDRFLADVNHPTDAQVEHAARLMALAEYGDTGMWRACAPEAKRMLMVQMNAAKWRLGL